MTDSGDFVPQDLSGEDESDPESSYPESSYAESSDANLDDANLDDANLDDSTLDDADFSEEVTLIVSEESMLSAITYLQNISKYVNNSECSCDKVQGMCFISSNQPQILPSTACVGNNCTAASMQLVISSRSDIEACLKLLSVNGKASLEILPFNSADGLPDIILQVIDTLTEISQSIIKVLNSQIYESVLDKEIYEDLKQFGMFALSYFSYFAHHLKDICADTYMRTTTDITIMGRHLAQKGLYYTLPSPVWPLFQIKNLLPYYIPHHEALCERYVAVGKVTEAWVMVWEVFGTDINLVSEKLVEAFSCILLKHEIIFSDVNRQSQLEQVLEKLHRVSIMDDILALGTLLYWETYCPYTGKLVIETQMSKVGHLLEIWMHWFHSVGRQLLDVAGNHRADVSLRFLRKLAELAIANFQNSLAVKSLCEAYSLSHKMKKWDVYKNVTQIIITLMPRLGVYLDHDDPENTDFFMNSSGLGTDSQLLGLVAIASYFLNTGQPHNFLHVHDAFCSEVSLRLHTDAKIVIAFSQAVMKRLEAEFLLVPGSRQLQESEGCTEPLPQALCLAISAYDLIEVMCTENSKFYFPKDKALNNVLGPWQIVHEYLSVTKLTGELLTHTGDVETGQIYFKKGLQAAETLRLDTWATIFHSKLVENGLLHYDLKDATEKLQNAQNFIESTISTSNCCVQHQNGKPSIEFVSEDTLPDFEITKEDQTSCSCQKTSNLREDLISDLDETVECRSYDRKDQTSSYLLLTDISGCCDCCQSEIIGSYVNIMCFQAEILWRKEKSICPVSSLLRCSLLMAHTLARMPLCTNITELFTSIGLTVFDLSQTKNSDRILAETAYRCAEIYFQNLYIKPADSYFYPEIENIISLLEITERIGNRFGGYGMCNVVASALLLKNSTNYLSVLKMQSRDNDKGLEVNSDSLSVDFDIIALTLKLMSLDGESENEEADDSEETVHRNNQQPSINLPGHSCTETVSQEEKPAWADRISDMPASISGSDRTDNSLKWANLSDKFPSLVAYQKIFTVIQRKRFLQRALQEICDFPHYWLYRQISQSLALCIWEEQIFDAWNTIRPCSMQLEMAAYLTASMHVTSQHKMYLEYCQQLCKHFWTKLTPDKAMIKKQAMEGAMRVFKFGGNVKENFKNRLASLPAGWTVAQITNANFDPSNPGRGQIFVTRINSEQEPITIGLPSYRNQFLSYAKKAYTVESRSESDSRRGESQPVQKILIYLQEVFLAGHKWLLRGQLDCVRQQSVQTYLDDAGKRAVVSILQQHSYLICYTGLRSLLDVLLEPSEADVLSLIECMWPPHVAGTMTQICMDVQRELVKICDGQSREKRGPVILILDNELVHFPWESMPDLKLDTITRMPSLANLTANMIWHTQLNRSVSNDVLQELQSLY